MGASFDAAGACVDAAGACVDAAGGGGDGDGGDKSFGTDRRTLFAGERLCLGADHVSEPSGAYEEKQPLAVVFGARSTRNTKSAAE
ncbi:hypothetical protein IPZ68_21495 [Streptomyces arenae]|nr:hypothetical protein [Streptomyces arenae]